MCPRTKEQNEQIRKKRMMQIRTVAAEVYLEKGLRMEIGDIAKKAGIGRGTVYHYYNNKIALLEDLLYDALQTARQLTAETLEHAGCPVERLKVYVRKQLQMWIEQPFVFILYKNFFQDHEPLPIQNNRELALRVHEELYLPVLDTIREGTFAGKLRNAGETAAVDWFFGTLIGMTAIRLNQKRNTTYAADHATWIEDVTDIVWHGFQR
ncbi:TetR/AcrR family transcriptional regulator [Aneurinibacillus sp. BA2021]|nr:TetR/AcrR family transcriptional regulator [Aneurinibacillus sp. BA2021]